MTLHLSKCVEFDDYFCNRPEKGLCLAHAKLNLQPDQSDRLKCEIEDVKRKLKEYGGQDPHQPSKGTDLILKHLEIKRVNNGLQASFWSESGTKCFEPTEEPKKNCAEVAMMGVVELILQSVKGEVSTADINWTADLTPCQVCTMRLPNQLDELKKRFPNTEFSYSHQAVLPYDKYEETKKTLKKKVWAKLVQLAKQHKLEDRSPENIVKKWQTIAQQEDETPDISPAVRLTLKTIEEIFQPEIVIEQKGELPDTTPAA